MTKWKDPMMEYQDLKEEVVHTAQILLEENPENKEIVFKILNDIQKDNESEIPRELDVEAWDDDSITFTDGLILLTIAKQDDKFISTIEGCWFGAKNEEPFQLPIPKKTEPYENQFNAIAQTIIQRGDVVNRYYLPNLHVLNNAELSKNPNFIKWKKIMFGIGLCGLDFIDVYKSVLDKTCEVSYFSSKQLSELNDQIKADDGISNYLIAMRVPENASLDEINKIAEMCIEKLDPECNILWQAVNHDKKEYEIIVLYN